MFGMVFVTESSVFFGAALRPTEKLSWNFGFSYEIYIRSATGAHTSGS